MKHNLYVQMWVCAGLALTSIVGHYGSCLYKNMAPPKSIGAQSYRPNVWSTDLTIRWDQKGCCICSDFGVVVLDARAATSSKLKYNPDRRLFAGCDWSPDGRKMVVSWLPADSVELPQELQLMSPLRATLSKLVTHEFGQVNVNPSWEPTGSRIAFLSSKNKQDAIIHSYVRQRLCVMSSKGGTPTVLIEGGVLGNSPLWSPKGHRLLVTSLSKPDVSYSPTITQIINADTHQVEKVSLPGLWEYGANHASWSPDGEAIVFSVSRYDGSPKTGLSILHLKNHSVSVLLPTSQGGGPELLYPSWSPDGKTIACVNRDSEKENQILLIDVATHKQRVAASVQPLVFLSKPTWSPDGQTIAYWQEHYGHRSLWRVKSRGGGHNEKLQ
jgi:Tol biopolymer transport system component